MEKREIIFGLVGIILGVALTLIFSSISKPGYEMMGKYGGSEMAGNGIDRHFIEQMIPHHEQAIAMANLALEKSTHPELKALAQNIVKSQAEENKQMQDWYKEWFGEEAKINNSYAMMGGMMSSGGMHMTGVSPDLSPLENAADFDKEFIREMIPHHQGAIMMAEMLQAGTSRPEMQNLAKEIIEAQSKEIEEMQNWYKNW